MYTPSDLWASRYAGAAPAGLDYRRGGIEMAERRMFAKSVISKTKFLMMPATARLLYYDLGLRADDDGVVEAYGVLRETGAREDDLRILIAKGFVQMLDEDELVMYISDWATNNQIRPDRYKPSQHHALLVSICPDADRSFKRKKAEIPEPCGDPSETDGKPVVYQTETDGKRRLGKVSIGKYSKDNKKTPPGAVALWAALCDRGFTQPGMEGEREVKQSICDFCQMRQRKGKAINTDATVSRLAATLAKIANSSTDPIGAIVASLNQSTENCWTGLFDLGKQQAPAQTVVVAPQVDVRRHRIT